MPSSPAFRWRCPGSFLPRHRQTFSVSNFPPVFWSDLAMRVCRYVAEKGLWGRGLVVGRDLLVFSDESLVFRRLRIVEEIVCRADYALRTLKAVGREYHVIDGCVNEKRDGPAQTARLSRLHEADDARAGTTQDDENRALPTSSGLYRGRNPLLPPSTRTLVSLER